MPLFNQNVELMTCQYITDGTLTGEEGRPAGALALLLEYPLGLQFPFVSSLCAKLG